MDSWFDGVLRSGLTSFSRCWNVEGGGSLALLSTLVSGLITRKASLEKNRTFCPVPGVFRSLRMDRTDPPLETRWTSSGVRGVRVGNSD